MEKLGIIAGHGPLPFIAAAEAKAQGLRVVAVAIKEEADPAIEQAVDRTYWISVGELGALLRAFTGEGVADAVMVGKLRLSLLFSKLRPDLRGALLYFRLKDRRGDTILEAVAEELKREGILIHECTRFLSSILLPKGVLTARVPNEQEWEDIRFGREIAKAIASLRIGQTVVVKNRTILAVESAEGTDEAIRRGGRLGRGGVVVKVSRPDQDLRFDLPVVGKGTVEALEEAKATALALDAGRTFLLDGQEVKRSADEAGIAIVAD